MNFPILAALAALAAAPASPPVPGPGPDPGLSRELDQLDSSLFTAVFVTCDIPIITGMIADDFEFYHDKDGLSYTSRDAFMEELHCRKTQAGDPQFIRKRVPGTLRTYPIGKDYALQTGQHDFYEKRPGQPDLFRETAHFAHLWHRENGSWRLIRVISYDHRVTKEGADR